MSELDPVYRCDSCQCLLKLDSIHTLGCCSKCGNKRVRNVTILSEKEMEQLKGWGLEYFSHKFEEVPE